MGQPAIEALELVQRVGGVSDKSQSLLQEFSNLLQGLDKLNGVCAIHLKEDGHLYTFTTHHHVTIPLMRSVKEELSHMEQLDVITHVDKPIDWCSGMVVVSNKNNKIHI